MGFAARMIYLAWFDCRDEWWTNRHWTILFAHDREQAGWKAFEWAYKLWGIDLSAGTVPGWKLHESWDLDRQQRPEEKLCRAPFSVNQFLRIIRGHYRSQLV